MTRWTGLLAAMLLAWTTVVPAADAPTAEAILQSTGVQGGFVVHLGCGDGRLTADLHANERYLVHGLDTREDNVQAAREHLRSKGIYGPVSVDVLEGDRLPYASNTVRLVVASAMGDVSRDEVLRVLAPGGVLLANGEDGWSTVVKARPDTIDEWSHFLHDAAGNAVAEDSEIGPPRRLRWVAEPRWCRSHEVPSSVGTVVTVGGRIFSILDEGPTGVYVNLPQDCKLVARDAFSGVLLWKVPLAGWQPEFGTGEGNRWNIHHTIPRRVVADGEHVYATLQFLDSPVSVLDAATGEVVVEALDGTRGADELLLTDGVLVVKTTEKGRSVGATDRFGKDSLHDGLTAVDVATGENLWKKDGVRVLPYALSAADGKIVYHDMDAFVGLDLKTGEELWRTPYEIKTTVGGGSVLALVDGVVVFHGHGPKEEGVKGDRFLAALSLDDGELLWRRAGGKSTAAACTQPADVFVVDGVVWCGNLTVGVDLRTGEPVQEVELANLISPGHHYRCHRSKATERYLIWPKRGAEFIDLDEGEHMRNNWLRAPCFTGLTPANGLLYVPPSPCFCYPGVKVSGYLAMDAEETTPLTPATDEQLTRGPAYGRVDAGPSIADVDWPMHRKNNARSGSTTADAAPTVPEQAWSASFEGETTQPVVVGDRLWIAEKDAHRLRCLDAASGETIWTFTAGGRIDSAPTITDGLVLFGCRDGRVYALRASDGALVWRFRATTEDRRIVALGQVESLWPIHGSVLVQDGVAYFCAGRSSFLDGGMAVYGLDARTGRVVASHVLEGPRPDIETEPGAPFAMDGALPDLFVGDGESLFMQRIKFDAKLNRMPTVEESPLGELDMGAEHLTATGGFLDDSGFDRIYWMHSNRWPGFYFAQHAPKSGQLVVFDDAAAYAVKYFYRRILWTPALLPGEMGYLLFADDLGTRPMLEEKQKTFEPVKWLPEASYGDKYRGGGRGVEKGTGYVRAEPPKWQAMIPLRIRAMLLVGDRLYAAGTPDIVEPNDPLAALEGRRGAMLNVYSTVDGSLLESLPLDATPAFDGLAAARGKLYLSTTDGRVVCFEDSVSR